MQYSPLILAAEKGHAECVRMLLKNGANITEEKNGRNCLMIATERKYKYVQRGESNIPTDVIGYT